MTEVDEKTYTERVPVTVSVAVGQNSITVTQDYSPHFDSGHYKYVIFDLAGNIVNANSTICGAPKGKLSADDAVSMLEKFQEEEARYG